MLIIKHLQRGGGYVTPNVCYIEETDGIKMETLAKSIFPIKLYEGQNDIKYTNQIFEWLDTLQLGDNGDEYFYSIYRRSKNVTDFEEYEKIYDDYRNVIILNDTLYSTGIIYYKENGILSFSSLYLYTIDGDLSYTNTLPLGTEFISCKFTRDGVLEIKLHSLIVPPIPSIPPMPQ